MQSPSLQYAILVTAPPFSSQGGVSAIEFCRAALASGHQILQVFFHGDASWHANTALLSPSDEYNTFDAWKQLATQYPVPLYVCPTSALRRGVLDQEIAAQYHKTAILDAPFVIAGLAQFMDACKKAHRVISFGGQ